MYALQFDGLYRGFPNSGGPAGGAGLLCYGWLITRRGTVVARGHGACVRVREASSNVAEYLALIEGLDALRDMGMTGEAVTVSGDAQTVIDQMRGASLVHSPAMLALHRRAARLAQHFGNLSWVWTPRRNNKAADLLTRKAMRQVRFDFQRYQELVLGPLEEEPDVYRSNKIHSLMDLRVFLTPAVQGAASAARSPSVHSQQRL